MPPSQPTREQMSHRAPEDRVTPKTLCARGEREGSRIDTMAATPSQIYSLTLEEAHRVLVEIGGLSPSLERLVQETVTAEINKRNGLPAATNGMPTIQPAAPVAAAEVPPIANGTVPGKDKETWADLTPEEQMAAQQRLARPRAMAQGHGRARGPWPSTRAMAGAHTGPAASRAGDSAPA